MFRPDDSSTGALLRLCAGYFLFYVVTGFAVKYYMGPVELGLPGLSGMEYLVYSTASGSLLCMLVPLLGGWYRQCAGHTRELLFVAPAGVCTAVVVPATTLLYTLPVSVMVAMVIMRGTVIVASRAVDAIQIRQGILKRRVYFEENLAVVLSLLAVSVHLLHGAGRGQGLRSSPAAMVILLAYVLAYGFRIYIMNYFKNTRAQTGRMDNRGYFALEQAVASVTLVLLAVTLWLWPATLGGMAPQLIEFRRTLLSPPPQWGGALLSGLAYGMVGFFSVFIFMFKGRTATFAGLVNRLTSLVAGTVATLFAALLLGSEWPAREDWASLGLIFLAVACLSRAERRRLSAASA